MTNDKSTPKSGIKGFFSRLLDKLDKRLEEKSKSCGCNKNDKPKGGSCCNG